MINNRQGGRRRGRGGQRPPNVGGQPGNRQDSRQRGNATQLLEKYKNMARDAQLGGDRVQSEYYLQFAEHYFRVLGESRSRFDEQRRQRGEDGEDEGDEEMAEAADEQGEQGEQRDYREPREQRPRREQQRGRQPDRSMNGSRSESDNDGGDDDERIAVEVLPPAIARDAGDAEDEAAEERPKRRARRPRSDDGDDDIAPTA